MLKVVIDTNVFISSVLTANGESSLVLKAWKRTNKYQLFVTKEIISENIRVMKRLRVPADIIGEWNKTIKENALYVNPKRKIEVIPEDPSDNKFLECAVEAKADYIITGDKHLKKINIFEGIHIVTIEKFLTILGSYKEN